MTRLRDRLRFPSMLEIFTISAVVYGLYLENIFISWTFAILALAWSKYHGENKE